MCCSCVRSCSRPDPRCTRSHGPGPQGQFKRARTQQPLPSKPSPRSGRPHPSPRRTLPPSRLQKARPRRARRSARHNRAAGCPAVFPDPGVAQAPVRRPASLIVGFGPCSPEPRRCLPKLEPWPRRQLGAVDAQSRHVQCLESVQPIGRVRGLKTLWSGGRDSNSRSPGPKPGALPS